MSSSTQSSEQLNTLPYFSCLSSADDDLSYQYVNKHSLFETVSVFNIVCIDLHTLVANREARLSYSLFIYSTAVVDLAYTHETISLSFNSKARGESTDKKNKEQEPFW